MANVRVTAAGRNAAMDAIRALIDAGSGPGKIKLYSGTQPANGDAALSGNTLLGTLTLSDPSAPAASGGVLTFSAITQDSAADATATATWARFTDSADVSVLDVDAGTSGTTLILNTASIVAGGPISITSATLTFPAT